MNRRLVGWLLLLALFVSALPWDLAAAQPAAAQSALVPAPASHPCPDPGPIGDPCGDGCLCPCCPAHTVAPPGSGLSFKTPLPPAQGLLVVFARDLHPSDFVDRVFHPPRLS